MEKKRNRPGDLRQQMNRMQKSRDNLKDVNREKVAVNKKLRDRNVELVENRNEWKARSKELDLQLLLGKKSNSFGDKIHCQS